MAQWGSVLAQHQTQEAPTIKVALSPAYDGLLSCHMLKGLQLRRVVGFPWAVSHPNARCHLA